MKRIFSHTVKLLILGLLSPALTSYAAWFEATGQAAVHNNNVDIARQRATQEAIQQALLFSGASIRSVQQLANGLLADDSLEIRASGDVRMVELINEHYSGDVVTVSIRADIFPQSNQCKSSDYKKSVVTTWFPIRHREQATAGEMFDMGRPVAERLQYDVRSYSNYADIRRVEPFSLVSTPDRSEQAVTLGKKSKSQFVLLAEITDISLATERTSALAFWRSDKQNRHFGLEVYLISATSGELVMHKQYQAVSDWGFDPFFKVNLNSDSFWQSNYGQAVDQVLRKLTQDIDEELSCIPAYGRILAAGNGKLTVDIGGKQGVQVGDKLAIFQFNQFYDDVGRSHYQYNIHPSQVVVTQIFHDSAVLESAEGKLLGNIQPNDYVVRY